MEVDFKDKDRQQSQGIYLFTGGIPDQDMVGAPRPGHPHLQDPKLPLGGCRQLLSARLSTLDFMCRSLTGGVVWMQNLVRRPGWGPESLHF